MLAWLLTARVKLLGRSACPALGSREMGESGIITDLQLMLLTLARLSRESVKRLGRSAGQPVRSHGGDGRVSLKRFPADAADARLAFR